MGRVSAVYSTSLAVKKAQDRVSETTAVMVLMNASKMRPVETSALTPALSPRRGGSTHSSVEFSRRLVRHCFMETYVGSYASVGQSAVVLVLFVASLAPPPVCGQKTNDPAHAVRLQSKESVRLPLIRADSEPFPGDTAAKDFVVRLPEHVSFQAGCELRLDLYPSLEILPRLCTITASINGKRLSGATVESKNLKNINPLRIRVRFPVPEESLIRDWNRISVRFVLRKLAADAGNTQEPGMWTIRRSDSYLTIVYQRSAVFPELVRFPDSIAEEKLLHPSDSRTPTLTLLVPNQRRDVHLRACAVIAARLGQLGYLSMEDCRVASADNWPATNSAGNVIAVGRRDELGFMAWPGNVADRLAVLGAGKGLIAEFIDDALGKKRRWLLVAGADDTGLEKAVLTLGNAPALATAPPNPIVIDAIPSVGPDLEATTQPETTRRVLGDWGVSEIRLSGVHRMEQSVSGWRLPPGFELSSGILEVRFRQAATVVSPGSWLEVLVNGLNAGTIELTPKTAAAGSARVTLPKGLGGRDPMMLTFRAHFETEPVECAQRREDEPWLIVSGDSTLETTPSLIEVHSLSRFSRLLLRDSFLRRAALLVPRDLSLDEVRWLMAVSMHLGRELPSSRVLWPEVCTYSKASVPPAARLQDRSIVLLGSSSQWETALPQEAPLLVRMTAAGDSAVRMQGSEVNVAAFEPSLSFVQLLASPWSPDEWLAVVGGWREFATPTVLRLLTDPKVAAELHGNICAMDAGGRIAAYDTRRPARDSLAERIQSRIPPGLSAEETRARVEARKTRLRRHGRVNTVVFYGSGVVLVVIVGCRLLLMWERAHRLKQSGQEHRQPLESVS